MADAYDAKMDAVHRVPTFSRGLGRIRRGPLDTLAGDSLYVFYNVYTAFIICPSQGGLNGNLLGSEV